MKNSNIGGQAVMEGVMMKNGDHYAVAVRKEDQSIVVDVQEYKALADRYKICKVPIIRGAVALIESMVIGVKTLTFSASMFEDEEEAAKTDKASNNQKNTNKNNNKNNNKNQSNKGQKGKNQKGKNQNRNQAQKAKNQKAELTVPVEKKPKDPKVQRQENLMMAGTVMLSVVLAIGIFMVLPYFLSRIISKLVTSEALMALIEGVIRVALFIGYVAAISRMEDIKRVFRYHGAEHKSINCIENGLELTVENVRKQSRMHKRCGTSFMLIVMVISVLLYMFIRVNNGWLRLLLRLLLIPVIAGISYEFIKLAGRSENKIVVALSKPGLALQKLTTAEPDDSMIEVAIASVEAVFDWRKFLEEYDQAPDACCSEPEVETLETAAETEAETAVETEKETAVETEAAEEAETVKTVETETAAEEAEAEAEAAKAEVVGEAEKAEIEVAAEPEKVEEPKKAAEPKTEAETESLGFFKANRKKTGLEGSDQEILEDNREKKQHRPEVAVDLHKPSLPEDEEDDEILKALDKFFDRDSKKQ